MNDTAAPDTIPSLHAGDTAGDPLILGSEKLRLDGKDARSLQTEVTVSEGFADWLHALGVSVAFTTSDSGGLHLVGQNTAGRVTLIQDAVAAASGLAYDRRDLCVATHSAIRVYKNIRTSESLYDNIHDKVFVQRVAYTISRLDVHEVNFDKSGKLLFVNTKYSCVAALHPTHSFTPLWRPFFISRLLPDDHCHLSGMALVDGELRYVSAFIASDKGWRGKATDQGIVMDTRTNTVIAEGLIKPHSPRFHAGALWVLDSGRGQLVRMDPATGARDNVAFVPGFLKGLSFFGRYAAVTSSRLRDAASDYLPLEDSLKARGLASWCAVCLVDVATGEIAHWIRFDGRIREMADVLFLPDTRCPWVGTLTSIGKAEVRPGTARLPQAAAPAQRPAAPAVARGSEVAH
jgi:uncharacterized protein (TIGR03032 family)